MQNAFLLPHAPTHDSTPEYSVFHFTLLTINTFATEKTAVNGRHVLTSRAVANLSLQRTKSTPAQPKPVPEVQHLLSRVLHARPTSLTQTTNNNINNIIPSARPPLPSLHRLLSISISSWSAISNS